jgi:hypothetical protein
MNPRLVAIDLDLDTDTPAGRLAARTLASILDGEREAPRKARSTEVGEHTRPVA